MMSEIVMDIQDRLLLYQLSAYFDQIWDVKDMSNERAWSKIMETKGSLYLLKYIKPLCSPSKGQTHLTAVVPDSSILPNTKYVDY